MAEQKDTHIQIKRLSNDSDYYTSVFKRVEKLVSVTFYVVSHIKENDISKTHLSLIKDRALQAHEISLKTLSLQPHEAEDGLLSLQYALVGLDSTLRVATAAGVLPSDIHFLITEQIDGVQRYLNNHYAGDQALSIGNAGDSILPGQSTPKKKSAAGSSTKSSSSTSTRKRNKVNIPAGDISSDAYLVYSQLTDRAERIKTVLEAKPQASVKDIAEIITDVSEKTIQRELNSLIEKGQVVREGERRWSRYSVAK